MQLILLKEDIEALVALRLTVLQAKVYLTLCRIGEANVITLSKSIKIARQEIYRVIGELQNRWLVEKVVTKPVRYKCVPIKEAVPYLLSRINAYRIEWNNKAMRFLERHRNEDRYPFQEENGNKLLLIPEDKSLSRRIKKAIEASNKIIKIVMPRSKFIPALFDFSCSLGTALERNVSVRWIINKHLDLTETSSLEYLSEFPGFKLRYIQEGSLLTFGLYDDNTLIVATNPKLKYVQSQAIWTNSIALVQMAKNYFRTLWANSKIY